MLLGAYKMVQKVAFISDLAANEYESKIGTQRIQQYAIYCSIIRFSLCLCLINTSVTSLETDKRGREMEIKAKTQPIWNGILIA